MPATQNQVTDTTARKCTPLLINAVKWVVPGKFLAGCYPSGQTPASAAEKIHGLIKEGITDIVCLMEPTETNHGRQPLHDYLPLAKAAAATAGRELCWSRHPIVDGSITTVEALRAILDNIDAALHRGGSVYVHCWGGRGRTGTIVCCWLIRHGLANPTNAVDQMHLLIGDKIEDFRPTPENASQRLLIEQWRHGR